MPSLALLLLSALANTGCETPTDTASVQTYLTSAEQAYEQLDLARFNASNDAATTAVPCLSEPLTPDLASALHRMAGIAAFAERDPELAEQRFASARDANPTYTFPTTMVPEGHPLLIHYTAIDLSKVPVLPVTPASEGEVLLDGASTTRRRDGLPVYFQRTDREGKVTTTQLLGPGATLPTYPRAPERGGVKVRILPLALIGGGVVVAGAGAVWAAQARTEVCEGVFGECMKRDGRTREDAEATNRTIRTRAGIGAAAGLALAGTGVVLQFTLPSGRK